MLIKMTMMKPIKVIKDPEAFKLLADDTRRRIIFLLRAKEMTVSQISQVLQFTPQAVYHHIKKMTKSGFVEVVREERLGHLIESYYRATAEVYFCSVGDVSENVEYIEETTRVSLEGLKKIGIPITYTDQDVKELTKLSIDLEECCKNIEYEDAINELEEVDFLTKQSLKKMAENILLEEKDYEIQSELQKKKHKKLRSLLKRD